MHVRHLRPTRHIFFVDNGDAPCVLRLMRTHGVLTEGMHML